MSQRNGKILITIDMTLAWRDFSDGKIKAKIRYQIPLPQRPERQGHSDRIVRRTRPYSLVTRSSQTVAFPLRERRSFMSKPIQGWSLSSCFGEASFRFSWGVSFRERRRDRSALLSIQACNQRNHPVRAWATEIPSKMAPAFALRVWKRIGLPGLLTFWLSYADKRGFLFPE
jgi:hypothetical protein